MKHWQTALAILMSLAASLALAEDFKTIEGKQYTDATVSHVEPDGIVLKTKSGISKVYFTELPKDVQQRFGYDSDKAREYVATQNKAFEETQKQQAEQMRQSEQETQKRNNESAKGQDAFQQWKNAQSLQDTLMLLQRERAGLEQKIQNRQNEPTYLHRDVGYTSYAYPNPARRDLPDLQDQLKKVIRTIEQTQKQIRQSQQAQH